MNKKIERINQIVENKTYVIENTNSIFDGAKYKFRIIGERQLISMGEWKDYIFVEVTIISLSTEEMTKSLGKILNGIYYDNHTDVYNHGYTTARAAGDKIEMLLKNFNINSWVIVGFLKYDFKILK